MVDITVARLVVVVLLIVQNQFFSLHIFCQDYFRPNSPVFLRVPCHYTFFIKRLVEALILQNSIERVAVELEVLLGLVQIFQTACRRLRNICNCFQAV